MVLPASSLCLRTIPVQCRQGRSQQSQPPRDKEHMCVQEHANRAGKDCQDKAARRLTLLCVATRGRMRSFHMISKGRRQSWSIHLHKDRRHARMRVCSAYGRISWHQRGPCGVRRRRFRCSPVGGSTTNKHRIPVIPSRLGNESTASSVVRGAMGLQKRRHVWSRSEWKHSRIWTTPWPQEI